MILIDTNIWAYYFDSTLPEHAQVIRPVEDALPQSKGAVDSTIVIEIMHYLVRRLRSLVGGERGQIFLNHGIPIYILDAEALELTLQRLCELAHLGIGGRDATILATMA